MNKNGTLQSKVVHPGIFFENDTESYHKENHISALLFLSSDKSSDLRLPSFIRGIIIVIRVGDDTLKKYLR